MAKIIILGSGKIGMMIATLLQEAKEYSVTLADQSQAALDKVPKTLNVETQCINASDVKALTSLLTGHYAVLNALPYFLTKQVATAALHAGCHYLDLTEDVDSTDFVFQLAQQAKSAFIPQCGLAPGFISIVAYHITKGFDQLRDLYLRVGALPKYPSNALKYNLTWSTDGLINEYLRPCEAIVQGEHRIVNPLEDHNEFLLDGIRYESFNTSGGLGSLSQTLAGQVSNLNYQSVRYPGHHQLMRSLIKDFRLGERPELLKEILEYAIPATLQDVVLIYVTVSGIKKGRLMQETYSQKVYSRQIAGEMWSAIQITTASAICAMLDLLHQEVLPQQGFVKQEDCNFDDFIVSRYGKNFQV